MKLRSLTPLRTRERIVGVNLSIICWFFPLRPFNAFILNALCINAGREELWELCVSASRRRWLELLCKSLRQIGYMRACWRVECKREIYMHRDIERAERTRKYPSDFDLINLLFAMDVLLQPCSSSLENLQYAYKRYSFDFVTNDDR